MRHRTHKEKDIVYTDDIEILSNLLEDFTGHMKAKITKQHNKGVRGWDNEKWTVDHIKKGIIKHVKKGDPIDVANLAMFWWNRENPEPTKKQKTLAKKHGTPQAFARAVMNALGEISMAEATQAIQKYEHEWFTAGLK